MAQTKKKLNRKHRSHGAGLLFTICMILIIAPFAILGWILFSANRDSSTPVIGNRYDGDLDPSITLEQMNTINEKVGALEGVESHDVKLTTATLRVYADINDDASAETVQAMADTIYANVCEVLDPSVYFTKTEDKKMYDLEIHVYNLAENRDAENFVYGIETKTSSIESPVYELVSSPKDAAVAQELVDAANQRAAEEAAAAAAAEAAAAEGEGTEGEGTEGAEGETTEGEQPAETGEAGG